VGDALSAGHIKAYGLSAWTTFHLPASHPQSLSLEDLVDLAQQAGGFESNGFRYIQVRATRSIWRWKSDEPCDGVSVPFLNEGSSVASTALSNTRVSQSANSQNLNNGGR